MHVGSSTRHLSELLIWREIYCKETKMCGHFNDITLKLWHNTKTNMTFSEKSQTQVQSILDRCIDFNDWNYFIPINFEFYLVSGQFSNWYSTYVFDSRYVFLPPSKHQIETFFATKRCQGIMSTMISGPNGAVWYPSWPLNSKIFFVSNKCPKVSFRLDFFRVFS